MLKDVAAAQPQLESERVLLAATNLRKFTERYISLADSWFDLNKIKVI